MIGEQITFIYVADLDVSARFYEGALGLEMVLDQGACRIYRTAASAYLGVCDHRPPSPTGVIVTLVTDDVDAWHGRLADTGFTPDAPPTYSERFDVYQFFVRDPDGYLVEFQRFGRPGAPTTAFLGDRQ